MKKNYWTWTCKCGFDDNRNTDKTCRWCGTKITCQQAGGHSWHHTPENPNPECEGGCGLRSSDKWPLPRRN